MSTSDGTRNGAGRRAREQRPGQRGEFPAALVPSARANRARAKTPEAREARQAREATGTMGAAHTHEDTWTGGVAEQNAGVLAVRGGRVIVMTEQAYILLLRIIHEHAPHIIKYAFYDMGYRVGVDIMAALTESDLAPEDAVQRFVERYVQAGYGDLAVTHFDLAAPEARLSGVNLFEAGLAPKAGIYRTPRVVDHYTRGMFAGFMSELLKREVVCEEVACQFRGDPRCEFVVLPFQS
jgi:predicted hydrocarbon binding protein